MAAGLVMGQASAADPIKLTIGGFYLGEAGATFDTSGSGNDKQHDSHSRREYAFAQSIEIHFKGETVLDNGLTVGARIELEGQMAQDCDGGACGPGTKPFDSTDNGNHGDQIDKAFVYFKGGFGQAQFGDQAEALGQMCYLVPSASTQDGTYLFGPDSPNFNFSNAGVNGFGPTNGTCYGLGNNSTEVAYFTPTFYGFSFGASFMPDNTEDSRGFESGGFGRPTNNAGQVSNIWSVGGQYKNTFDSLGGLGVVAGGAISGGTAENTFAGNSDDVMEYDAYAQLSYAGFTLGGAWSLIHNGFAGTSAGPDDAVWQVFGVGLTYQYDAWIVGIGATRGLYDNPANQQDQYNIVSLTGSYALGPGIFVDGAVEYYDYNGSHIAPSGTFNGLDGDYSAIGVGIGLGINF
jgi:hypothetical protein